ncbi:hypothetical protein GA0070616_0152, partial [Micromonospora nigra]
QREPVAAMRQPVIGRQRRPDAPEYAGSVFASEAARVLGRPLPLWWAGTTTPELMRTVRLLDQPRPVSIPDTITEWPAAIARLTAALEHSMHTSYPQAFALLARETRAVHRDVSTALTHPSTGDGWYLAAAPQPPTWPAVAEQRAAVAAGRDLDPEAAADELDRLAQVEATGRGGPATRTATRCARRSCCYAASSPPPIPSGSTPSASPTAGPTPTGRSTTNTAATSPG